MDLIKLKVVPFIKNNGLFTFALAISFSFLFIVIVSLFLNMSANPNSQPSNKTITRSSSPPASTKKENSLLPEEEKKQVWGEVNVSDNDLQQGSTDQKTLENGSTQYSYASNNPGRSNVVVIKNGIIVFQRNTVYNETIANFTKFNGKPENVLLGSNFYGPTSITYAYLSRGTAFVADLSTKNVLENLTFKPLSINDFFKNYADLPSIPNGAAKQSLSNKNIKYSAQSSNPQRTDVYITDSVGNIIFRSFTIPTTTPVSLANITSLLGQPKWVFNGSSCYGNDAKYYIYADLGISFAANPKTDQVLEEQTFLPTSIDNYIKNYGDDIPAQP